MRTKSHVHHIPALDGLRTIALALVLIHHLTYTRLPGGRIGVDLFFVLSGFLITGVLLREREAQGRIDLVAFYFRRFLRLMPALAIVVIFSFLLGLVFKNPSDKNLGSSIFALTYMMDFVRTFSKYSEISPLAHTWSLAVEEHFYLIWPLILGPIAALPVRKRPAAIACLWLVFVVWRAYLVYRGVSFDRTYYALDTRFDELLAGCALTCLVTTGRSAPWMLWVSKLWPIAFLGLLFISVKGDGVEEYRTAAAFMPVIVSFFSCVIIAGLSGNSNEVATRLVSAKPMVYIGKISYGVYLWHYPLLLDARRFSGNKSIALLAIVLSVVFASLSYHYAEQPILRLKRKIRGVKPIGMRDADSWNVDGKHTNSNGILLYPIIRNAYSDN